MTEHVRILYHEVVKKSQRGWNAVNKEKNKVSEVWGIGHERVAALFISTTEATEDHHLENKLESDKNENKGPLSKQEMVDIWIRVLVMKIGEE